MSTENVYETPESELISEDQAEPQYAGFWIRALASIIDTILIMLVTMPALMTIYGSDYWLSEQFIQGAWDIFFSYIFPAVAVVLFWIYKSATPGKMICGLKVISLGDSEQLSAGRSIGRYLAYYPSIIVLGLGFLWVAFDKRKQGWHDKLAKTAVVKKSK